MEVLRFSLGNHGNIYSNYEFPWHVDLLEAITTTLPAPPSVTNSKTIRKKPVPWWKTWACSARQYMVQIYIYILYYILHWENKYRYVQIPLHLYQYITISTNIIYSRCDCIILYLCFLPRGGLNFASSINTMSVGSIMVLPLTYWVLPFLAVAFVHVFFNKSLK